MFYEGVPGHCVDPVSRVLTNRFLAGEFDNIGERLQKVYRGRGYSVPGMRQELSLDEGGRFLERLGRVCR